MGTRRISALVVIAAVLLGILLAITGFPAQTLPTPGKPWSPPPAPPAAEKVIVGLLRDDGTIMPFARYDGLHWTRWTDSPEDPASLPNRPLKQIPKEWRVPPTWRLWLPSLLGRPLEIHVTGLQHHETSSPTGCENGWGFGTDFPKAVNIDPNGCPDGEIGIALSTDLPLEQFRSTDPTKQGFPSASLNRAFTQAQAPKDRKPGRIRVEGAWTDYQYQTFYYIEATKRYGGDCSTSESEFPYFQGWFFHTGDAKQDKVLSSKLYADMDCDFKGAELTAPEALIHLNSSNYVIAAFGDWENNWYEILKIESNRVSVAVGR